MGSVHVTDSVKELCRDNAKGLCKRGNTCRFLHAPSPETSNGSSSNATPAAPRKFTGDCNYCKKQGHKSKDCFKKKRDEKAKRQRSLRMLCSKSAMPKTPKKCNSTALSTLSRN